MSHPRAENLFLPRDYVATREGFLFAVVGFDRSSDHVLGHLRYANSGDCDEFIKVRGEQTQEFLRKSDYLWHCPRRDCLLPAIPVSRVTCHYRPEDAAARLLAEGNVPVGRDPSGRTVHNAAVTMARSLVEHGVAQESIGITGSLLLDRANPSSDIDFVLYGRQAYSRARDWVNEASMSGLVQSLTDDQWDEMWRRRGCPMSLADYVWHEKRKANKGYVESARFDINLVQERLDEPTKGTKVGVEELKTQVVNADASFDWPASYIIDHPQIQTIQTYTATYFGQAECGEQVVARGMVEELSDGSRRLMIGLDRDAQGHYLRVDQQREKSAGTR